MKIDIWSDVICPFCYIGKRKLELALEKTGLTAEITWRSFELNPGAPQSYGISLAELLGKKYGLGKENALAMLNHEEHEAAKVGLDFEWRKAKPGNTFDAHRLLHLAKEHGIGGKAKERFLRAYFTEGQEIGDPAVLRALAVETGLDAGEVDAVLASNRFGDAVRADEQEAMRLEIQGVPHFVINGKAEISGAQDVSEFVRVLREQEPVVERAGAQADAICADGICRTARM